MSKSTFGLRRAGLATLAVSLMMGGALVAAPAQADWASSGGEIGLVDTNKAAAGTQGATLIYPGVSGQKLADVRLLIPNTFKNGDTIDLTIFDRTATATNPGQINADAAHKLGFGAAPTVTVNQTPVDGSTHIGPTSASPTNTEGTAGVNAPTAVTTPGQAATPPVFSTSLVQSSRANGLANDIIRLRINGVQAAGRASDEWIVTLSGLTADLGAAVSPGELRVVPFAYNGSPSQTGTNASHLFDGNIVDKDGKPDTYDPEIDTYTVPAYVAPVNFNIGAPNNILADGTTQKVGDVVISETNNFSLQNGTYRVAVAGATVKNDASAPVKVTASNAATGETVTSTGLPSANGINFTLAGASNTSKLTVTLSGLLLASNNQGPITYTLSGGSIDGFMASPAGDSTLTIGTDVAPDAAFVTETGEVAPVGDVNQTDIEAPALEVNAVATPLEHRIGGGDRYETAAKIALNNGANDYVVLASGENFPDALSSGYLSNQIGGGSILLTRQGSLPQPTLSAMRELGTRTVFVVGGSGAVSETVVNQLRNTPQYYPGGRETIGQGKLHVVRLAGSDRYETNQEINEYAAAMWEGANPVGRTNITFGEGSKLTALVATGQNYADALAAGPATSGVFSGGTTSVWGNLPLILTRTGELSAAAKGQLTSLGIEQVVLVGGTGAVSAGVESAITGMGIKVKRVAGANRYATATALADFMVTPAQATATREGGLGFDPSGNNNERAYLATGQNFADALAGGPLAGGSGSPILLTNSTALSAETKTWLSGHAAAYGNVVAFGLGGAVAPSVLDAANAAISAQ